MQSDAPAREGTHELKRPTPVPIQGDQVASRLIRLLAVVWSG